MPILMVLPTGVGCSIGGYAGDGIPSARLLAAASGCLITHPNVMNAASLYWNDPRIHYVEGYGIDHFASGKIYLRPVRQQKIGVIIDSGLKPDLFERHMQVLDACRASLGLNIGPIVKTKEPLEITLKKGSSGASWGGLENPHTLLSSGDKLKELGATAVAIISCFPEDLMNDNQELYRLGKGADPLAGAEAIISHLLVRHLMLPCANSPALLPLSVDYNLDPRAAAEDIGYTFLASVLVGLNRAPDLIPVSDCHAESANYGLLHSRDLGAIVAPDGALGGEAVLACLEKEIPVIAVKNPGILDVGFASLGLDENRLKKEQKIHRVINYAEAAGLIISLREGINISSLYRPIERIKRELFS